MIPCFAMLGLAILFAVCWTRWVLSERRTLKPKRKGWMP